MNIYKIFLALIVITQNALCMFNATLQDLPNEIIQYIAALNLKRGSLAGVNKHCYTLIKQLTLLEKYPHLFGKKDHIYFMVKHAKNNNTAMINCGLKTPSCHRPHYLKMFSECLPADSPLNNIIATCTQNPHNPLPSELMDPFISFLQGKQCYIDTYKQTFNSDCLLYLKQITCVHAAINNDSLEFTELFLAQNPTLLNQRPEKLEDCSLNDHAFQDNLTLTTPLELAIRKNSLLICKCLLSFKDINLDSSPIKYTLLQWTAHHANEQIFNYITQYLKKKLTNQQYLSLFTHATVINCLQSHSKLTLPLIKETNYTIATREEILLLLLKMHKKISFHMLKELCENTDININAQNANGDTLLMIAIEYKSNKYAEYLLQKGADPTIHNKQLSTALHIAAKCSKYSIFNILPNKDLLKKHINSFDSYGYTPLLLNLFRRDRKNDSILLFRNEADPNLAHQETGNTPLIMAALRNDISTIKVLLEYNADPTIKNKENKTAYDYAKTDEARELLKVDTNLF